MVQQTKRALEIRQAWDTFMQRKTLMVGQPLGYFFGGTLGFRCPPLSGVVISLLYVNVVVSVFELSLRTQMSRRKFDDLEDLKERLEFLAQAGRLIEPDALDAIRKKRNQVAHEITDDSDSPQVTREELEAAINIIRAQLEAWQILELPQKVYAFHSERSAASASDRPRYSYAFNYKVGVTRNGRRAIEYT